ncbi:DJ-1/PfpI family protein [Alteromonas halophila]|uniref:DJ-1/PfpI domain-containing protein n=1 Tax=Alteromonas halophila TaxID=516698 RepID=A0A918JQD3_9ALTE|nr:DJ-1/PfpI family protein [Alteromonas halophila]GGW93385.1 hypothetical protein GCM10007391_29670 [Alteromonas halophila]
MPANAQRYGLFTTLISLIALVFTSTIAFAETPREKPFTVAILLFDDVQIIDFAAPYEVFGQADFDVFTVSQDGKTVTTAMGLSVNPAHAFTTMPEADAILVPGGDVHDAMHNETILTWLKAQQQQVDHILSVCTGSHIVAESGLLDSLAATTFHNALEGFAADYPDITVKADKRFVDNGQIITSAGLSSGIDASLHLVSKIRGINKARSVALHIEYDWDPQGNFVRAAMADRHFPDNTYQWPEGILFNQLSSVGDESAWKTVYRARTDASAADLLAVYKAAMSAHNDWQPAQAEAPNTLRWVGGGDHKGWLHAVRIEASEHNNTYHISLIIEQHQNKAAL